MGRESKDRRARFMETTSVCGMGMDGPSGAAVTVQEYEGTGMPPESSGYFVGLARMSPEKRNKVEELLLGELKRVDALLHLAKTSAFPYFGPSRYLKQLTAHWFTKKLQPPHRLLIEYEFYKANIGCSGKLTKEELRDWWKDIGLSRVVKYDSILFNRF